MRTMSSSRWCPTTSPSSSRTRCARSHCSCLSQSDSLICTQNLTASLVSWLSLFPASPRPTKPTLKDYILSLHHPSTPFGLGLALLAIFQSSSLSLPTLPANATPEDLLALLTLKSAPPATLIFAPATTFVDPLYKLVLQQLDGDASFIVRHARDGKLRLLREGTVSKQTFWDSILCASRSLGHSG